MQDLLDMVLTALHQERGVWHFYPDFFYEIWIFLYMYMTEVIPSVVTLRTLYLEDLVAKLCIHSLHPKEECDIFLLTIRVKGNLLYMYTVTVKPRRVFPPRYHYLEDISYMVLPALHPERGVWNFYHDFPYDVWIFLYMYYLAVTPHVIPLRASFLEDLFAKLVYAIRQSPY